MQWLLSGQQVTQDHVPASDIPSPFECSHVFLGAGPRYEEASPKTANLRATQLLHDDILNNSSDYMFSSKYTCANAGPSSSHVTHDANFCRRKGMGSNAEAYEPALMTDFKSRSTLLILATHMTIAITPAQERNFTCMHAASDTHVPAVTTRIHGWLTHRSETNVFSILTYMQAMSSSPNMHVVHLLYLQQKRRHAKPHRQ